MTASFPAIPSYALYGEASPGGFVLERCHCESIPARSRLHQWEIQPHRHPYFLQILYMRQGGGTAVIEGRPWRLEAPCVVVVPAGWVHGFRFTEDVQGQVVTAVQAGLPAALVGALAEPQLLPAGAEGFPWERFAMLVDLLVESFGTTEAWRGASVQAALNLILVEIVAARGSASPGEMGRGRQRLRHYYQLVERHFRTRREIGFYADALGLTATQLNRICRAERGLSALAVIHRRLVAEAERDLAYTHLSIKEVALALGFQDAAYFSRFFQRQTGMSPSEFRQRAHSGFSADQDAAL